MEKIEKKSNFEKFIFENIAGDIKKLLKDPKNSG